MTVTFADPPKSGEPRYAAVRSELVATPRRWLVTGAAGFIGSNLVEALLSDRKSVV